MSIPSPQSTLTIGQPFSLLPTVSGTKDATTFEIDSGGTLPAGVTLDASTGEIRGTMTSDLIGTILRVSVKDKYSSAQAAATLDVALPAPPPVDAVPVPAFGHLYTLLLILPAMGFGVAALYRANRSKR